MFALACHPQWIYGGAWIIGSNENDGEYDGAKIAEVSMLPSRIHYFDCTCVMIPSPGDGMFVLAVKPSRLLPGKYASLVHSGVRVHEVTVVLLQQHRNMG
jgi:hypothetical protein